MSPRRRSVLAALAGLLIGAGPAPALADDEPLELDQAVAAAVRAAPAAAAWSSWPGRELRLPDATHLAPEQAAALAARWRFYEIVLVDLRSDALAESVAMAYGISERARGATPRPPAEQLDALELRYLEQRARRDALLAERRISRRLLAAAMGTPARDISDAREPAAGPARPRAQPPQAAVEAAVQRARTPQDRAALRLLIERSWLELQHQQGSAREHAQRRQQAADARVDEARARLDRDGRSIEFGLAMSASVDAKAGALAVEYQAALLLAWLEATLGAPLAPAP